MNKLSIFLVIGFINACMPAEKNEDGSFFLSNETSINRADEPIVLTREILKLHTAEWPAGLSPVIYDSADKVIPQQHDDIDGDGEWDEIAFTAEIPANTKKQFSIKFTELSVLPAFDNRTNVRFGIKNEKGEVEPVTEYSLPAKSLPRGDNKIFQMDGPAWENDLVGYRHYFDGRNTRDLFGKTTRAMVLDEVGLQEGEIFDNYHVLNDWGRDVLSVGNSIGLGGIGAWYNGEARRIGVTLNDSTNNVAKTDYKLIVEGPVRSIFEINYNEWQLGEATFNASNKITIWAGQYGFKGEVAFEENAPDTIIVGLVNSNNNQPMFPAEPIGDWIPVATHDKQTYDNEYWLGMALIVPANKFLSCEESGPESQSVSTSFNALIENNSNTPFHYYTLSGWELTDDGFAKRDFFEEFLQKEVKKIDEPVILSWR